MSRLRDVHHNPERPAIHAACVPILLGDPLNTQDLNRYIRDRPPGTQKLGGASPLQHARASHRANRKSYSAKGSLPEHVWV